MCMKVYFLHQVVVVNVAAQDRLQQKIVVERIAS